MDRFELIRVRQQAMREGLVNKEESNMGKHMTDEHRKSCLATIRLLHGEPGYSDALARDQIRKAHGIEVTEARVAEIRREEGLRTYRKNLPARRSQKTRTPQGGGSANMQRVASIGANYYGHASRASRADSLTHQYILQAA